MNSRRLMQPPDLRTRYRLEGPIKVRFGSRVDGALARTF